MRPRGRVGKGTLLALLLCIGWFTPPARAELPRPALQLSAGVFDISKSDTRAEVGVELRLPVPFWKLEATAGLTVTEVSARWLYFGVRRDFRLAEKWVVAPGLGVSQFASGNGKSLGGSFEFRSAVDLGYRLAPRKRLGLTLYHLSNAGYFERNPGSNSLVVTFSFDFD